MTSKSAREDMSQRRACQSLYYAIVYCEFPRRKKKWRTIYSQTYFTLECLFL